MELLDNLNKAFAFACERHSKQYRKATTIPYIVHIYEVYQYLREEGVDEEGLIAGILHDVVEDTGTSLEEIREKFGEGVASLVDNESEDKSLPYIVRKKLHMDALKECGEKAKLINCADKLSNLRSIYLDIKYFKDDVWKKFNGTKDEIKHYYTMAIDALSSLEGHEIYSELKRYFKLVFEN